MFNFNLLKMGSRVTLNHVRDKSQLIVKKIISVETSIYLNLYALGSGINGCLNNEALKRLYA